MLSTRTKRNKNKIVVVVVSELLMDRTKDLLDL